MHIHLILTHLLAQATTSTTKAGTSSKKSSSYAPILILVAVFAVAYFLFIRPRSQRLRQQQATSRQLGVGDEVMTAGGMYGKVVAIDADDVEVEVANGVVITFARRAVNLRQQPGPVRGGVSSSAAAEPVDEPWDTEPDGPGDTAGPGETAGPGSTGASDEPPASSSHWDEPSGDDPPDRHPSGD